MSIARDVFMDMDSNRDGKVDREEVRNWITKPKESIPTYTNEQVIHTNSQEETNRYLETATNIYRDPNPKIIRRPTSERPITAEQRIRVRYLQPPPLPPPEPLIVIEKRPDQPPPPPPLVIREQSGRSVTPTPLILRERPPVAPAIIRGETVTRYLPALPVPQRSVIIERFQNVVEKPRDITIERWLPYGPQPERQTIVKRAAEARDYEQPTNTIIIHDNVQVRVARKFERLGISQEDPESYLSRYGSSLLDSSTLLQEARNAGIVEDLSLPAGSTVVPTPRGSTYDFDRQNETYVGTGNTGSGESVYAGGPRFTTGSKTSYVAEPAYSTSNPADININIMTKKSNERLSETDRHQYI